MVFIASMMSSVSPTTTLLPRSTNGAEPGAAPRYAVPTIGEVTAPGCLAGSAGAGRRAARVDVADVALDGRDADALDGVVARHRGVGEPARVEYDADRLLGAGLLDPIDDHALVVRLTKFNGEAMRVGGLAAELLDVFQRR